MYITLLQLRLVLEIREKGESGEKGRKGKGQKQYRLKEVFSAFLFSSLCFYFVTFFLFVSF